jgi:hypothetical protein
MSYLPLRSCTEQVIYFDIFLSVEAGPKFKTGITLTLSLCVSFFLFLLTLITPNSYPQEITRAAPTARCGPMRLMMMLM